ncbi:MAG: periplasmic heavy metal sensor [Rhodoferax sp.]|uniref:periplasmic heavy metal sensor n=1 Tax=Rhodoferax sp. TaxID=50421 RepID=UPI0013FF0B9D|nr:periplasmic heavy metal sensor [Rhodoferax sp.]NDP39999.1 periplasmic heavy metal sensor [Rhodoferax sp.]
MKRYWIYLLLAISLLVNVGVLAGAWFQVWRAQGATELAFFGMGHERVPDYLKLDGPQIERWHSMEQDFVKILQDVGSEIQIHRERLVREIFSAQPDASVVERERAAIFMLQEAQQRSVIEQLIKEREMLNAKQRLALADLLLKQYPRSAVGTPQLHAR